MARALHMPARMEFFGVRVQDDVVERLRVAVEHRRHHPVARCRDPVAKDPIDLRPGSLSRRASGL